MYTTIEADIDHGIIRGPGAQHLPAHAHVLITLIHKPLPRTIKSGGAAVTRRQPPENLRGTVNILGDVIQSVPQSMWNLP